ncbi:MAG: hypothetical protein JNL83_34010 [Myxococcales bacterium]|nr:hypothetical protein [Myxococcales bacterium]
MKALGVVLLVAVTGPAAAETETRALGDGYTLLVENYGAFVVKDRRRARLGEASTIDDVKVDKKARTVTAVLGDYSCEQSHTSTWTFGHLDARLENAAAYALHRKKDYKAAAAGFARAAAADPTWNIPAYNLASAHQLAGDRDSAVKALAPWLASAPIATYVQVTSDPELAPLLARPELTALRAAKAGTATITADGEIEGDVVISRDKGLLAVARSEASWGACSYTTELELRDLKTGALVARTPVIGWSETSPDCEEKSMGLTRRARPVVAKRVKALTAMLRELGFSKAKLERGSEPTLDGDKAKTSFVKARLGLVAAGGTARLLSKNTELGTARVLHSFGKAVLVDDPKLVVIWSLRPAAEGCEGSDPTEVAVMKLTP